MRRARGMVVGVALSLAVVLISPISSQASQTVTQPIANPCAFPEYTWIGTTHTQVLANGVCGYHIQIPSGGSFTITPWVSADFDVYTYNTAGQFDQLYGNTAGCGTISNTFPSDIRDIVITLVPSTCTKIMNATFTYAGP